VVITQGGEIVSFKKYVATDVVFLDSESVNPVVDFDPDPRDARASYSLVSLRPESGWKAGFDYSVQLTWPPKCEAEPEGTSCLTVEVIDPVVINVSVTGESTPMQTVVVSAQDMSMMWACQPDTCQTQSDCSLDCELTAQVERTVLLGLDFGVSPTPGLWRFSWQPDGGEVVEKTVLVDSSDKNVFSLTLVDLLDPASADLCLSSLTLTPVDYLGTDLSATQTVDFRRGEDVSGAGAVTCGVVPQLPACALPEDVEAPVEMLPDAGTDADVMTDADVITDADDSGNGCSAGAGPGASGRGTAALLFVFLLVPVLIVLRRTACRRCHAGK